MKGMYVPYKLRTEYERSSLGCLSKSSRNRTVILLNAPDGMIFCLTASLNCYSTFYFNINTFGKVFACEGYFFRWWFCHSLLTKKKSSEDLFCKNYYSIFWGNFCFLFLKINFQYIIKYVISSELDHILSQFFHIISFAQISHLIHPRGLFKQSIQ